MAWCCYALFCLPFAMYSMGGKLGEKTRIHYFVVFIFLVLALSMKVYATFMILDGEGETQADFNKDYDQDRFNFWTIALLVSNICFSLLGLTKVILAIKQRRLFS